MRDSPSESLDYNQPHLEPIEDEHSYLDKQESEAEPQPVKKKYQKRHIFNIVVEPVVAEPVIEPEEELLFSSDSTWTQAPRFVKFPRPMIADKRLSIGAKALALALESFDIQHGGIVFPGMEKLALSLGITRQTATKYRKELEEAGYLMRDRRYGTYQCTP